MSQDTNGKTEKPARSNHVCHSTKLHLTETQITELREAFTFFDEDGNERISSTELRKAMQAFGDNPTLAEAEEMIKAVDRDGNGTVEFNEFVELMGKKMVFVDPEKELKEAFRKFDRNGDGKITPEELRYYLTNFGDEKFSIVEAEEFIREFDTNHDGVIDYQEFCHMITNSFNSSLDIRAVRSRLGLFTRIMENQNQPKRPSNMTQKQFDDLRDAFNQFDKDGDNTISVEELGYVIRAMGQNPTEKEIQKMMDAADLDKSGRIEFNEFVELMAEVPVSEDPEEDLLEAFRVFDKDGNGFVTAEEFKATMTEMGDMKMSMQDVEDFIREADADGDGNLNYQEFVKWICAKK
ncbi:uncharacterized protein LOC135484541 [Lineus longissimus]|uniref:uncharacterized protein LOC135484541 n=1 Tax=Lineus longissimus TaxID=88925 RepID=UPI00315D9571